MRPKSGALGAIQGSWVMVGGSMAKIGGYVVKIGSYRAKSGAIGPRLGALWPRLRHLDSILWAPGPRFRPLSLRMVALGPQSGLWGSE